MKVKICGMRESENIVQVAEHQPDYMGFIFFPGSKRYAESVKPGELSGLNRKIKKTGVFVDAGGEEILEHIKKYRLDAVQLHGNESADLCDQLNKYGIEVIKAFGVDENFDFKVMKQYRDVADYFLFDTKTVKHGGSGQVFDWDILKKYKLDKPYFLSGGLNLQNLLEVRRINDERLFGVDLNSCFEITPGLKDLIKVKEAIEFIRS